MHPLEALKQRAIAAGLSPYGWEFIGPDGQVHRRRRCPTGEVSLYDIDLMTPAQLEALTRLQDQVGAVQFAQLLFPERPIGYRAVARTLLSMARIRLLLPHRTKEYEQRYRSLPRYARFREFWNPIAAVQPGKKFRRNDGGKTQKTLAKNLLTSAENAGKISTAPKRGDRRKRH